MQGSHLSGPCAFPAGQDTQESTVSDLRSGSLPRPRDGVLGARKEQNESQLEIRHPESPCEPALCPGPRPGPPVTPEMLVPLFLPSPLWDKEAGGCLLPPGHPDTLLSSHGSEVGDSDRHLRCHPRSVFCPPPCSRCPCQHQSTARGPLSVSSSRDTRRGITITSHRTLIPRDAQQMSPGLGGSRGNPCGALHVPRAPNVGTCPILSLSCSANHFGGDSDTHPVSTLTPVPQDSCFLLKS